MSLRATLKLLLDLGLFGASIPLAYILRLDTAAWDARGSIVFLMAVSVPLQLGLLYFFGLHRHSWRNASIKDVSRIAQMAMTWTALQVPLPHLLSGRIFCPRSIPLISGALVLLALAGMRGLARLSFERSLQRTRSIRKGKKVLIVGAGQAGTLLAREMLRHPDSGLHPAGYLDDDRNRRGQEILGFPVLGNISDLISVTAAHGIDEVLIAIPSASGEVIRRVVGLAAQARVPYRIMPGLYDLMSGKIGISQLREVDVADLLRRKPVVLELREIAQYLEGKVVLITGAGGSIGSELVRQVARFNPLRIILLGRGENSIYSIEKEARRLWPALSLTPVIADVRDREKLRTVFEKHRPHAVFHAAAHKHVPLMEANPDEAVFNNIGGTQNVAELCLEYEVQRLVNISTDKAVNPTSVMGASKRAAEQLIEQVAGQAKPGQSFVSVRFGNVLGSRGSVIPLFKEQISRRDPVTVTHPDMTRYFMTIPEAAQLVLQAGGLAQNGAVYVLDMGEPVRILDLARDLIQLSGLVPGEDVEIVFTGLRPGEKLYEELLTEEEGMSATRHSQISVARKSRVSAEEFQLQLKELWDASFRRDPEAIRAGLAPLAPGYGRGPVS
jgi:FlaA1/EpsC-like NDP-sugar epimerase